MQFLLKQSFFLDTFFIKMFLIGSNSFQIFLRSLEFSSLLVPMVVSFSRCVYELVWRSLHFLKVLMIRQSLVSHVWTQQLKITLNLWLLLYAFHFYHLCRKFFSSYPKIFFPVLQSFHKVYLQRLHRLQHLQF